MFGGSCCTVLADPPRQGHRDSRVRIPSSCEGKRRSALHDTHVDRHCDVGCDVSSTLCDDWTPAPTSTASVKLVLTARRVLMSGACNHRAKEWIDLRIIPSTLVLPMPKSGAPTRASRFFRFIRPHRSGTRVFRWYWTLIPALGALLPGISAAQHDMQHMAKDSTAATGKVHFDNSCAPQVQTNIDLGLAYLYSFWFPAAQKQFAAAAQRDPQCAIAYWGEAMSGYEQISGAGLPEGAQLKAGVAAIAQARSAHHRTAREQSYIDAIAIIYDAASLPDHDIRVRRYCAAMGAIAAGYPADNQAAVLYAMSLLKDGLPADPDLIR